MNGITMRVCGNLSGLSTINYHHKPKNWLRKIDYNYNFVFNFFKLKIKNINRKMPKIVDNYVLERKIGNGQFGDVFKGYNKINN